MRDPFNDQLGTRESLATHIEARRAQLLKEIDQLDANRLLQLDLDDLARFFESKYKIEPPSLVEGGISLSHTESKVDVTGRFEYASFPGERTIVAGTDVCLHVPLEGETDLLDYRVTLFGPLPRGRLSQNELIITFRAPQSEVNQSEAFFKEHLTRLRDHVRGITQEAEKFNASLLFAIRAAMEQRRSRLLATQDIVASIGYPLKPRSGMPQTYSVPNVRRQVHSSPAPANLPPYAPEPALSDEHYAHILTVLGNMVRVMEQSPEAFSGMGEQDLRTHFLVQLNGHFEGRASGETFRGSGKTDILLIDSDKSIFIAECKFWNGPASVTAAIDQLLDYATWRDAKAALVLFNRRTNFSAILDSIPEVIKNHPKTDGDVVTVGETVFRSKLRLRDDSTRRLILTTLAYNVPSKRTTSARLRARGGRSND